jgi:PiT family inorganic phosphate transporter
VSTTHAITSSTLGVGITRNVHAVRWGVTFEIFFSWLLSLPAAVVLGAAYVIVLRWALL